MGEHPRLMFAVFFASSNSARKEQFHFSCQLLGGPEPTTEAFSIFQLCWGWLCPWFLKMGMSQFPRGSRNGWCFSMFLDMFWIGNQAHSYILEEGEAMRDTRPRLWILDCDWRWRVCIFCCHAGSKWAQNSDSETPSTSYLLLAFSDGRAWTECWPHSAR